VGDGFPAGTAGLDFPNDVTFDASGNLFIADTSNHRVRKVNQSGIITTVAGNGADGSSGDGGPATSAQLFSPIGLAVDASGNLFIADQGNHRIRIVDAARRIITTAAGTGTRGFAGDGGPRRARTSMARPASPSTPTGTSSSPT
jgi:sugar lactone lactonase YvrE